MNIPVTPLGQAGFRFQFDQLVVYIDPYLSDSVERTEGETRRRMVPVAVEPARVDDADYVLITHAHLDHCDPDTIKPISDASPLCRFVCPAEVKEILLRFGIAGQRIIVADEAWVSVSETLRLRSVPAAHPKIERDLQGNLRCVGYVLEFAGRRVYHAGDTSVDPEVLGILSRLAPVDVAILPVNERNFFREKDGIIGNMTVREAFAMAADIGAKVLVPMHWDMFKVNSVFREEIELLYRLIRPNIRLVFNPTEV